MKLRIAVAAFASAAALAAIGGVTATAAQTTTAQTTTAQTTTAQTTTAQTTTAQTTTPQTTTPQTTTAATQAAYAPPRCYIGDLSAGFHGYQVEMGSRGFLLTLTNISNHSCSLYGYPGLELLNARMQPLPTTTLWGMSYFDRNQVKSLVVLSPGETASADISFGVYGTPANSVLASYLEVTPPNCYSHFILKIPYGPALVYLHQLQVTPMARHTPYLP